MGGTLIINIRNIKDFTVFLTCPKCKRSLIPDIKKQLGIDDKLFQATSVEIYDKVIENKIKEITTDCCWFKVVYRIHPKPMFDGNIYFTDKRIEGKNKWILD